MIEKKAFNRAIEIAIVQLNHATGRQRDELVAKLIYDLITEQQSQATNKRRPSAYRLPNEGLDL